MTALLDKADQMASMDWRVAPVPWRQRLANPGRPLKVALEAMILSMHIGWVLHGGWHLPPHPRHGQGGPGGCPVAAEGRTPGIHQESTKQDD